MEVDLTLAKVTLGRLERLCQIQGVHLDDVLALQVDVPKYMGTGEAVLDIIAPAHDCPPLVAERVATAAGQTWMQLVQQHLVLASMRAKHYAERCGVWEIMQNRGGGGSMARILSRFDPSEHQALWHDMQLVDAMTYLLMRAVDELTENLDDYV